MALDRAGTIRALPQSDFRAGTSLSAPTTARRWLRSNDNMILVKEITFTDFPLEGRVHPQRTAVTMSRASSQRFKREPRYSRVIG